MKAALIGGGVIGGGWAARFLLNGWNVALCDPDPEAARKIDAMRDNARRALPALYDRALPPEGSLRVTPDLAEAVAGAAWVQESIPERLEAKQDLLARISAHAPEGAVIASSTSGFKPSDLNAKGARAIVAHPFNPVYLLPLVELVGADAPCTRAAGILRSLGMHPLRIGAEIDAHIADRLLEAVWREALWLVRDDIATTEQIDDAIRMGFGLRWAQMGLFETYRIAGGEDGMAHFLAQFGPALHWPWSRLTDVPELTDELITKIAAQSDAQSGQHSIRDLERLRDDNLVAILRALKAGKAGAGATLAAHEAALPQPPAPISAERPVPSIWTDYNGHMNETHYLELASNASDRLLEQIGADSAYVARGFSFFTVENHLRYLAELRAGETVRLRSQILRVEGKKLHLFHHIETPTGAVVATVETLMLHVDLNARRSCPPSPDIAQAMAERLAAQGDQDWPDGAGRVGQR